MTYCRPFKILVIARISVCNSYLCWMCCSGSNLHLELFFLSLSQPYLSKFHMIMLSAFGSTLKIHDKLLTLIAIVCEICALFWYSLSYIPFARRMVSDLMVKLCDTKL